MMIKNTIAVIWDFDKTLINGYMQEPIFKKFGIEENTFWKEVNEEPKQYIDQEIRINKDTYYLNHFLKYVQEGKFKNLNNELLFELGKELKFCDGLPEFFETLNERVTKSEKYKKYDIKLEHYIVSTGLTKMIRGSKIASYVKEIWGCEFIEETNQDGQEAYTQISQIAYAIDNTSKTRAIFEINKGINVYKEIDVNSKLPHENRRVPISNMIYIADGPSDVPVFSVMKKNGGKSFAVYRKGNIKEFEQVDRLRRDGRVDMYGEADYRKDTLTYMWLSKAVDEIAENIYNIYENEIKQNISSAPKHITEE